MASFAQSGDHETDHAHSEQYYLCRLWNCDHLNHLVESITDAVVTATELIATLAQISEEDRHLGRNVRLIDFLSPSCLQMEREGRIERNRNSEGANLNTCLT